MYKRQENEYRQIGDIMNLNWDSPDSYRLNIAAGGVGEINNVPGEAVLSNVSHNTTTAGNINTLPFINGFNSSTFGNRGHLNRMLKTNMDLVTTGNSLGQIFASGSISNWFQPSMTVNSANTLTWTGMATIPLNKLHDFFDKLPTVGSSQGFEIRIQTNIGTSNTYNIGLTQPTSINTSFAVPRQSHPISSMTPFQTVGHTCPFMISPAGYMAGTGLSVSNIANETAVTLTLNQILDGVELQYHVEYMCQPLIILHYTQIIY